MPYSDPHTASTGNSPGNADWNSDVRDNFRWSVYNATGGAPFGMLTRTTDQNGLTTDDEIVFDTTVRNVGGIVVDTAGTKTLEVPAGGEGLYRVDASARLNATYDGSGTGLLGLRLIWNVGADVIVGRTTIFHEVAASRSFDLQVSAPVYNSLGGEFKVHVVFTNMTSVNVEQVNPYTPVLSAQWLGRGA